MDPAWLNGLLGGVMIGGAAAILLLGAGRIAGVSGLLREALASAFSLGSGSEPRRGGEAIMFILALALSGAAVAYASAPADGPRFAAPAGLGTMAFAGLIVGVGVRLGNGCTSGHGVCGLARVSKRSIVATAVFMATCAATVAITRHGLG